MGDREAAFSLPPAVLAPGAAPLVHVVERALGIPAGSLEPALLTTSILEKRPPPPAAGGGSVGGGSVAPVLSVRRNGVAAACRARDALAATLYGRAFQLVVARTNAALATELPEACAGDVGVLDFFGAEALGANSLETLCINYAAERLQVCVCACVCVCARVGGVCAHVCAARRDATRRNATLRSAQGRANTRERVEVGEGGG